MNIFRCGFRANQQRFNSFGRFFGCRIGIEHHGARSGARRSRKALGDDVQFCFRVDLTVHQLLDVRRLHLHDRFRRRQDILLHQVIGDLHGRAPSPLAVAGLQHVQAAPFDRELDVLHVLIVMFQRIGGLHELFVHFRHLVLEFGNRPRRTNAGDDVLALRIGEKLAVESFFTGGRIPGEGHAGAAIVAHVAEHHRLDIDRCAEIVRNPVQIAIDDRPFIVPGAEYRFHRHEQLLHRILREGTAGLVDHQFLIVRHQGRE